MTGLPHLFILTGRKKHNAPSGLAEKVISAVVSFILLQKPHLRTAITNPSTWKMTATPYI